MRPAPQEASRRPHSRIRKSLRFPVAHVSGAADRLCGNVTVAFPITNIHAFQCKVTP